MLFALMVKSVACVIFILTQIENIVNKKHRVNIIFDNKAVFVFYLTLAPKGKNASFIILKH